MILKWKPTTQLSDTITASDDFLSIMDEAGYRLPCSLTDEDLPVLRGMVAASNDPKIRSNLRELINCIINHDSIDLTTE